MLTTALCHHALDGQPAQLWVPPEAGYQFLPAGIHCDAVRALSDLGDRARRLLADEGEEEPAIIRDHYTHYLYWLVPPRCTEGWTPIDGVTVYGGGCDVEIPPPGRTHGLAPVWPTWPCARLHTKLEPTRDVLREVIEDTRQSIPEARR
ncbi:hypothetical protein [Streptomyces albus]|uniref:hypothetical protein n=1 Tax=Streptomyces albus TaxID=1888 RepID=UPI00068968E2|nr:hypothetical protein [Streptomyces albus]